MKKMIALILILHASLPAAENSTGETAPLPSLNGTWCAGDDGMQLTFSGNDTLSIGSTADESMGGSGIYRKTDSTFSATLKNGDLTLSLKYLYRWKGKDTVEARALEFTINDEAVDFPKEWMSMGRCGKKGK